MARLVGLWGVGVREAGWLDPLRCLRYDKRALACKVYQTLVEEDLIHAEELIHALTIEENRATGSGLLVVVFPRGHTLLTNLAAWHNS